jgi:hypothetical protein
MKPVGTRCKRGTRIAPFQSKKRCFFHRQSVSARKSPLVYSSGAALTDGVKALFVEYSMYLGKPYESAQLLWAPC